MLAGGLGSAFGSIFGGGGSSSQPADYSSLYAQLAPINTRLTYAGQELMANMAPYLGAEAAQTNLIGQSSMTCLPALDLKSRRWRVFKRVSLLS
jgi:hypothetical protein